MKVYNKGIRPIVLKRGRTGVEAIHPGKFMDLEPEYAKGIIDKFENACSEDDLKKKKAPAKKPEDK